VSDKIFVEKKVFLTFFCFQFILYGSYFGNIIFVEKKKYMCARALIYKLEVSFGLLLLLFKKGKKSINFIIFVFVFWSSSLVVRVRTF